MRLGYTTGSCAAGAAKAALQMLLTGKPVPYVELTTPKGIRLNLEVLDINIQYSENTVSCAVKKDAGDDPDVTDGLKIYASVCKTEKAGIRIDGGEGVGRVTREGLEQSVGSAAINSVPRAMIQEGVMQEDYMDETSREEFLQRFSAEGEEKSLLGFCVLGGIFGEGIDLKNDSLIGAVIVGTGLPQVCNEREILKNYFEDAGDNGFDYAYRYPGMNKVLQAAGRVIRTAEDVGVVALLDERFLNWSYQKMFPREWDEFETVTVERIAKRVERFWDEWL